jgi:predicted transcriptional regulator
MKNPSPLQAREQKLIELYSHSQLAMTPRQFYAKWDVNQEAIAQIPKGRSAPPLSTVQHWFAKGRKLMKH